MGDDAEYRGSRHVLTVIACLVCAVLAAMAVEYLADPPALARQYIIKTESNDFSRQSVMREIQKLRPKLADDETAMLHFGGSALYRNIDPGVLAQALGRLGGRSIRHAVLGSINQRMIDALDILAEPDFPDLERAVVVVTWSGTRLLDRPARMVKNALEMDRAAWNARVTHAAVKWCCTGGLASLVGAGTDPLNDFGVGELATAMTRYAPSRRIANVAERAHEHAVFHAFRALIGERSTVDYKRQLAGRNEKRMRRQENVFVREFNAQNFSERLEFNISVLRILFRLCKNRGWSLVLIELPHSGQLLLREEVARGVEKMRKRLAEFAQKNGAGYAIAAEPGTLTDALFHDHMHVQSGQAQTIATRVYADAIARAWRN